MYSAKRSFLTGWVQRGWNRKSSDPLQNRCEQLSRNRHLRNACLEDTCFRRQPRIPRSPTASSPILRVNHAGAPPESTRAAGRLPSRPRRFACVLWLRRVPGAGFVRRLWRGAELMLHAMLRALASSTAVHQRPFSGTVVGPDLPHGRRNTRTLRPVGTNVYGTKRIAPFPGPLVLVIQPGGQSRDRVFRLQRNPADRLPHRRPLTR
jgi:hypothetical protein